MRLGPAVGLTAALLVASAAAGDPAARYLDSYAWQIDAPWFGGFSGLELSADGREMTTISDRGFLVTARIIRTEGRIIRIENVRATRLRSSTGAAVTGRIADAEGLAVAPDGTICISYEGVHRVACHASRKAAALVLDRPPAFRDLPRNGGFEALAIDSRGRLFTLPEDAPDPDGTIPVYRWDGSGWSQPFGLPQRGRFLPVGADFGPDGRFYLLERAVGFVGFRTRLRRWEISGDAPANEVTLLETFTGTHDNLEGVSIWRDSNGTLHASLIADDNFLFFQRTEIVDYTLPE